MAQEALLIDTYAILADFTGQATPRALRALEDVRAGRVTGVVHAMIIYELAYHWRMGRAPFLSEEELLTFISSYFKVYRLSESLTAKAAGVKVRGDEMLSSSSSLRHRRLSACDSLTIAIALEEGIPIVSGDKDLSYVAERLGVKVVW